MDEETQLRIESERYATILAGALENTQQDIVRLLIDIKMLSHLQGMRQCLTNEGAADLPAVALPYTGTDQGAKTLIKTIEELANVSLC